MVLNLIINGLLSIFDIPKWERGEKIVLNLIINGLLSIFYIL